MSDAMRPIPFPQLMEWALTEYEKSGSLFGVYSIYRADPAKALPLFGGRIEVPAGPAAGPHTQMAQNLIAAYAAGARFFELKTVQVLDGEDLPIAKPCIRAEDEGYNVEWSTELRVPEALNEYVKAWFAIKLIAQEFGLGAPDGFAFNMSVGYDLAGIQSDKIDRFIEGLRDAGQLPIWSDCADWAVRNLPRFRRIDRAFVDSMDARACNSVTLSTLHGCPPDEIERIASYLIDVKGLNTFVKCNPTLLGYAFARETMDAMGYRDMVFDDHHFTADLQFEDAVPMFRRLMALAERHGLEFGVKLSNTLPVQITAAELPGDEMYMSGKALFPLTIALAEKLERAFDGKLRASFSGGADLFNIGRIFQAGIWPVTLATTLLKLGGYNRLTPIAAKLSAMEYAPFGRADVAAMGAMARDARRDPHHRRPAHGFCVPKLPRVVPLADCFVAPCAEGCPIRQDVPAYVDLVGQGRYLDALRIITEKNPLPSITGAICNHRCMSLCARNFYEQPVQIRAAKRAAAERAMAELIGELRPRGRRNERVAVVGGGPGGMAAAFLLARAGAKVTIFEKRGSLGGVVRHAIPAFRIGGEAIDRDAGMLEALGVEVRLNAEVADGAALRAEGFTHVIAAIGAGVPGALRLESGAATNAIAFLEEFKRDPGALRLGKSVAVVGGGNTAMDAARAAMRAPEVEAVSLVYRRTVREMPADAEELELALGDGVLFRELLSPVSLEGGMLRCEVMKLGAPDASGRRSPVGTGEFALVPTDALIAAVGESVDGDALARLGGAIPIGDARRGPATVVEAIADATEAVRQILGVEPADAGYAGDPAALRARRAALAHPADAEGERQRCLGCSAVCENCVDACPNRANVAIPVDGKIQILHIDALCNGCGNCATFCPYESAPYRDKFTVFGSETDFADSRNEGFLVLDRARGWVRARLPGREYEFALKEGCGAPPALVAIMRAVIADHGYIL